MDRLVARPSVAFLREQLYGIEDPELGLSILELGLVYRVEMSADGEATVDVTLTSPACPVGPLIMAQIDRTLRSVPGVDAVDVHLVWDPPWDPRTMASEDVRLALGVW